MLPADSMNIASIHQDAPLVLIIEDDKSMRILLRSAMEQEGYQVAETTEGEQGLVAFTRLKPDIVLLDALMPVMDGFTCCAQLQTLPEGECTPVLIITGLEDKDSVDRAFAVGATDYVTKPIHWAVLRQRVRRLLQQSHLHKQLAQSNQELQAGISQLQQTERALLESQERYALAARGANDGLWDWNLKTNEVYFSPRWKSMLGCRDDISNNLLEWFDRVHPQDLEPLQVALSYHLRGMTPHFENEHRMLHKDGTYRWMLNRGLAVRNADGQAYRIAGSQTDTTERKQAEEQLVHDAFHDALTGLPNRVLFMKRLEEAIRRAQKQENYLFAVLFLDLDRFKVINDSLGHLIGDQLLVAIARRLETCLRLGDTVARLGGDEFTILLNQIQNTEDATRVADRIQEALMLPFDLSGHEVFTAGSIGIAVSTTGYDKPEDLLRDADTTMYRAKALGKGRFEVFDGAMLAQARAQLQLETDLRKALDRQEFRLHYQPIVALNSGRIAGFEALVRWQHPLRGLVCPAEFIPLAEETGLIVPLGWWILREACHNIRLWQMQFPAAVPLTVSVNFSGKQFLQPNVVEQICLTLKETGLDASSLGLEITESALMENVESASTTLNQLRSQGVNLFLDDFGTGYSSLSHLHRFPFNTLKIDRSFISRMGEDGENAEIVRTIVALAHNLSMSVTAEGVETATQLAQLSAFKCEYGQGYLFSKPLSFEAGGTLIKTQSSAGGGSGCFEQAQLQEKKPPCVYPEHAYRVVSA